jgi:hypothetical protein
VVLTVLVPLFIVLRPPLPKRPAEWGHQVVIGILVQTLYEKRFAIAQHPVTSNLVQYAVGFAAVLPLAWALEDMHVSWSGQMIAALTSSPA